jgi:hypothetical protein
MKCLAVALVVVLFGLCAVDSYLVRDSRDIQSRVRDLPKEQWFTQVCFHKHHLYMGLINLNPCIQSLPAEA